MCKLEFRTGGDAPLSGDAPLAGKCLVVDPDLTPDQLVALELAAAAVAEHNREMSGVRMGAAMDIVSSALLASDRAARALQARDFETVRRTAGYAAAHLLRLCAQATAAERLRDEAEAVCPDLWPVPELVERAAS